MYLFCFSPAFCLRWNPEPEPFHRDLNENLNPALISVDSFLSQGKKKSPSSAIINPLITFITVITAPATVIGFSEVLGGTVSSKVYALDPALLEAELGFCGQIRSLGPGRRGG